MRYAFTVPAFALAGALVTTAQAPTVLLNETFDDNGRGWREQNSPVIQTEVSDGAFRMQSIIQRQQYVVQDVGLDPTADFDIECRVEIIGGNAEWPVGLLWGHENGANFLEYLIWMDGRLRIDRNSSNTSEELMSTIASADIATGQVTNTLKLSRRGGRLTFSLNGVEQGEIPFDIPIGPRVGFVVWNEIEVRFDDFVVTQY